MTCQALFRTLAGFIPLPQFAVLWKSEVFVENIAGLNRLFFHESNLSGG